ncbi:hypothetical protein SPBR_05604 [Sporothrix brasiliensis 5110]|uniref:Cell wall anchored protein n=1 Tax=Sporothrix brasiliensis 5110 TaxID=1398154 RepID=A0A0C2FTQ3_9PEZI|nr:uncharacterized protein SPBR_05604 [Sporothrix brasiliensis 5110]KIH94418.1 hypothetical protein SPBR_05604 [Sporothrix brasiliensis 5110]
MASRLPYRRPASFRRFASIPRNDGLFVVILGLFFFVANATGQQDPINNFCRRFGHQSAVVDRRLYIDGGLVNWNPISTYPGNYSNTWLLYQDLARDVADVGMPPLYANLSKNSSIPDVSGGSLWGDEVNKYLYLFGGEYYQQPPPTRFLLYAYDILNNFWVSLGPPQPASISPVSYGAGAAVSERGEGYYYGGWLSNNSVSGWGADSPPVATTGLVKYDMDTNSWTNNTGPDGVRRAEGALVFIPAGDGGMLVYLGGITDLYGNGTVTGQGLDTIYLYDVLSSKWYAQHASGTIPGDRRRFCAGVTWAADQSSYNIYLYGGASMPPDTAGYDDMYVLSLPTFTWIKLYPTDGNVTGQYPHHSLTCNVVSGAQMLIIGGTFPLSDDCDVPQQWGTHNADLTMGFAANKALWQLYAPNETTYLVPDAIVSAIGGGPSGGATKTAPAAGWDSPDLKVLMTRTASIAARTPTRNVGSNGGSGNDNNNNNNSGGSHLATGAIAGIAVGGAVAVILFVAGCWTCLRRYRERRLGGQAGGGGGGGGNSRPRTEGEGWLGRRRRYRRPFNGPPGFPVHDPYYGVAGAPGTAMMMMHPPVHHGRYTDAPTPPGGWSPQHGSPYSPYPPTSPYAVAYAQPPIELAASSGSGYMHLTPVGSALDSGSNTGTGGTGSGSGTGTGMGTGTGSSGTYNASQPQAVGKSPSDHGSGRGVWTAQVSEVQTPPPRSSVGTKASVGEQGSPRLGDRRHRATGSDGSSPLARAQELSAEVFSVQDRPQGSGQVHNTYYHK